LKTDSSFKRGGAGGGYGCQIRMTRRSRLAGWWSCTRFLQRAVRSRSRGRRSCRMRFFVRSDI